MMTLPYLLAITTTLLIPLPTKTVLEYDVLARGDVIGHIAITKSTQGQKSTYHSINVSEVRIIKKFKLNHELEATFTNGVLEKSEVTVYLNGNLHSHTLVKQTKDGKYAVFHEDKHTEEFSKPITYAAINLYFEEPNHVSEVFSEQFALWNPILPTKEADFDYILDKKGNPNYYRYENGKLVFAHIGTRLMATQIQLVEN